MHQTTVTHWDQGWAPLYDALDNARAPKEYSDFYASLTGPDTGSLLDVGCGTGSITSVVAERLRAHGADRPVTGVDLSQDMLDVAARRHPDVEWLLGDIRHPPVAGRRYDLAICCFYTMQVLSTDEDLATAFASIREALTDGGRFAFDIHQPNTEFLSMAAAGGLEDGRVVREFTDGTGRALRIREHSTYDPESLLFSGTWHLHDGETDERIEIAPMVQTLRQIFPDVAERLLDGAGLKIVERYGDLDRSAFTPSSKRQVLVCARR
ncbi:MAG: class I SAM-dependent methyltransferase [Pseudomonadota bacterium]